MVIKPVKAGVYMVTGNGGNTTVRLAKDGVILVDTKNPGDAIYKELLEKIKTVTPLPVKYVIITHHHNDHSGNSVAFENDGIPVLGHREEMENIEKYTPAGGARKPAQPSIVYSTSPFTVDVGGTKAVAYHFAPGHTSGDTLVYFPDVKVVSGGDDVVAVTPNTDYPFGGSVLGWQTTMNALMKLDFDTVIPGHGDNPMTKAEVATYKAKWDTFIERAKAAVKAGTPKAELMAKIKTDDLGWNVNTPQWTAPARLDPFYAELSK